MFSALVIGEATSGASDTPSPRSTIIAMAASELSSKRSFGTMPTRLR
ncbi:MAG: hypothetical protein QOD67_2499 [Caballeronia sp.]|nr:hypothetical protein [Caballeronia sp.]